MPTKYRSESQKPWKTNTIVHSPYMPELVCYKTEFWDGTESYSEAFDPDDPTLVGAVAIIRQSDSPTNALNWWKFWKIIWPKMIYS